jgi:hypothetical protein
MPIDDALGDIIIDSEDIEQVEKEKFIELLIEAEANDYVNICKDKFFQKKFSDEYIRKAGWNSQKSLHEYYRKLHRDEFNNNNSMKHIAHGIANREYHIEKYMEESINKICDMEEVSPENILKIININKENYANIIKKRDEYVNQLFDMSKRSNTFSALKKTNRDIVKKQLFPTEERYLDYKLRIIVMINVNDLELEKLYDKLNINKKTSEHLPDLQKVIIDYEIDKLY